VRWLTIAAVLLAEAACGGKKEAPAALDAAVATGATAVVVPMPVTAPPAAQPMPSRARLHLSLRSTPAGAAVTIDGRVVGTAPVRWELDDDGKLHSFVFTMPGYSPWRLQFSPSQDGVVHATLQTIPEPDAGALP